MLTLLTVYGRQIWTRLGSSMADKIPSITAKILEGTFKSDADMADQQSKAHELIERMMRESGYVPVLNMATQWYVEWNSENDSYDYTIVKYGVQTGKRKSKTITGWDSDLNKWYT